jgi:hypothetical protein
VQNSYDDEVAYDIRRQSLPRRALPQTRVQKC